jgi:exodeoxyribonuclease VII large subunit
MADQDQDAPPKTLAGLWLKSKPSPRPEQPQPAASRSGEGQMGLVFSTPIEPPPTPVPPSKLPQQDGPSKRPHRVGEAVTSPPPGPRERRIWTVRALVTDIRQHVETSHADLWVEGEISNCRPAPSGHIYFTLKDGEAQLPVVLFRRQAQLLRFRPQDGLAILARGRISVYESRGQLQLIADTLEPRGAGALQLAFEQLREKLKAEGLFDAARKRPLPAFPRCIGVVTSTRGAVLHDIIKVIRRRHARLNLLIYPALMQGPDCSRTVAAGIRWFNKHPQQADLILLARGGGSLEDLAGFNDEALARTIAASQLPIVSAIGHETDFTIADFVADLRAPTPSAAAELITAAQHRIEERVAALDARVLRAIRYQLILARQRFTTLSTGQLRDRLHSLIGRRQQRLDDLHRRLEAASTRRLRTPAARLATLTTRLDRHNPAVRLALARRRLEAATQSLNRLAATTIATRATRLRHATARLDALSPLAVLSRGYALIYKVEGQAKGEGQTDGTLLRNAADTAPGQRIHARLATGSLTAEVQAVKPE